MEWLPWVVLVAGVVVIAVLAPRLHRRERERQRFRGTIPGAFGVVDEAWRPSEHAARLERERREEAGEDAPTAPDLPHDERRPRSDADDECPGTGSGDARRDDPDPRPPR